MGNSFSLQFDSNILAISARRVYEQGFDGGKA